MFAGPYMRDDALQQWIRKVMATGHLPLALLKLNFRRFVSDANPESRRLRQRYPALVDFVQYMERTYVGGRALFPPRLWCVYERRSDNRSNNWVEGENLLLLPILLMLLGGKPVRA